MGIKSEYSDLRSVDVNVPSEERYQNQLEAAGELQVSPASGLETHRAKSGSIPP